MGYYEFPHTRNYDSDLGFLIKKYKELGNEYNTLVKIYEIIKQNIEDITIEQLQKWLEDGTLENLILQLGNVAKIYTSTVNLLNSDSVVNDLIVQTLGYNDINDGGACLIYITNVKDENIFQFKLKNDLYGNVIDNQNNALVYGFDNTGENDNTNLLNSLMNKINRLYFPYGTYLFETQITLKQIELYSDSERTVLQANNGFVILENVIIHDLFLQATTYNLFTLNRNLLSGNRINFRLYNSAVRNDTLLYSIFYITSNNNYLYDVLVENISVYGTGKSVVNTYLNYTNASTNLTALSFNNIKCLTGTYQYFLLTENNKTNTGMLKGVNFINIDFQYIIGTTNFFADIDHMKDCIFDNITVYDSTSNIYNIRSSDNSIFIKGIGSGTLLNSIKIPDNVEFHNVIPILLNPSSFASQSIIAMYPTTPANNITPINRIPATKPLGITDGSGDEININGIECMGILQGDRDGFQFGKNNVNRLCYRFLTGGETVMSNWYRIISEFWFPYGITSQRPSSPVRGYCYLDTTLNKPVWWNGTNWIDANGTSV